MSGLQDRGPTVCHSPGHFGSSMEDSGPSWHGEGDVMSSEDGEVSVKLESGEFPWSPPSGRAC